MTRLPMLALCAGMLASGCASSASEPRLDDAIVACAPVVDRAVSRAQDGWTYRTVLRRMEAGVVVGATMPLPRWRRATKVAFRCLLKEIGAPARAWDVLSSPPASGMESWSVFVVRWTWDAEDGFSAVFAEF